MLRSVLQGESQPESGQGLDGDAFADGLLLGNPVSTCLGNDAALLDEPGLLLVKGDEQAPTGDPVTGAATGDKIIEVIRARFPARDDMIGLVRVRTAVLTEVLIPLKGGFAEITPFGRLVVGV